MEVFLFLFILAFVDVFFCSQGSGLGRRRRNERYLKRTGGRKEEKNFCGVKHVKKPWNELLWLR